MKTVMMRLSFALILLGAASCAVAQPASLWRRTYGGSELDMFYAVCESADSNILCAGETQSYGLGLRDFWLVKLDENGDTLWTRTYGGLREDGCFAVKRASAGGYILAGRSTSFRDSWNGYAVRVDSVGDTLWTRQFGGPQRDEFAAICETPDNGFLFTGTYGGSQFWAVKLDANGELQWNRTYGGSGADQCYAAAILGNGYYLAGSTESYGNGHSLSPDYWLLKINFDGDSVQSRTFGGTSSDVCTAITLFPTGGGALCGYTQSFGSGLTDFWIVRFAANGEGISDRAFGSTRHDFGQAIWTTHDNGLLIAGNVDLGTGSTDYWVIKTDADLNPRWSRHYGGTATEDCRGVMEMSGGRILLVGGTYSNSVGSEDGYVVSTDPPVAVIQATPLTFDFGSVLIGDTASRDLELLNTGTDSLTIHNVLAPAGFSSEAVVPWILSQNSWVSFPVIFDPQEARAYHDTLWVISSAPTSPTAIVLDGVGVPNSAEAPGGTLPLTFALNPPYPNPFNASTMLSFDLPHADRVNLAIFDIQGRLVECLADGRYHAGRYRIPYNAAALSSGVFFARLQGSSFSMSCKLVLMK